MFEQRGTFRIVGIQCADSRNSFRIGFGCVADVTVVVIVKGDGLDGTYRIHTMQMGSLKKVLDGRWFVVGYA